MKNNPIKSKGFFLVGIITGLVGVWLLTGYETTPGMLGPFAVFGIILILVAVYCIIVGLV